MSAEDSNMPRGTSPGYRYYLQQPVIVMFLLGFSAGLPFLLVYSTLSAWLKDAGLQMSTISTLACLGDCSAFDTSSCTGCCLPKNATCSQKSECCSNNCKRNGRCA